MRLAFSIILSLLIVALIICHRSAHRSNRAIARSVKMLIGALVPPIIGNLIIGASSRALLSTIGYYGHSYVYAIREEAVSGYFARYSGYDITNTRLPAPEPGDDGETPGSSRSDFAGLTEEDFEDLHRILDNATPNWGSLLATGDETPLNPFVFGGAGLLALAGKKRRKRARG